MTSFWKRLFNVAVAEDEAANSEFGGSPRETISGTVGRAALRGAPWAKFFAQPIINFGALILAGKKNHCQTVAAGEEKRREETGE